MLPRCSRRCLHVRRKNAVQPQLSRWLPAPAGGESIRAEHQWQVYARLQRQACGHVRARGDCTPGDGLTQVVTWADAFS